MKVIVDGLMTEYVEYGKGKVILFLHGWGSNMAVFNDLIKFTMCDRGDIRAVALNLPGFGGTDRPSTGWGVGEYAEFVAKFIKKLGLKDIYAIVGHSFGGRIMLKGVGEGQLSANKLVFMGSAGVKPPISTRRKMLKLGKPLAKLPGFKNLAAKMRSSDYAAASGVMREVFKNVIGEDLTGYMPKIKQPSLLIWGENDTETPVSDSEIFAAKIPGSTLHVVQGAGHYAFLDQPYKVARLMTEFLK